MSNDKMQNLFDNYNELTYFVNFEKLDDENFFIEAMKFIDFIIIKNYYNINNDVHRFCCTIFEKILDVFPLSYPYLLLHVQSKHSQIYPYVKSLEKYIKILKTKRRLIELNFNCSLLADMVFDNLLDNYNNIPERKRRIQPILVTVIAKHWPTEFMMDGRSYSFSL